MFRKSMVDISRLSLLGTALGTRIPADENVIVVVKDCVKKSASSISISFENDPLIESGPILPTNSFSADMTFLTPSEGERGSFACGGGRGGGTGG